MEYFYTFFLAFFLIFLSELGDKTQLLVLSFSAKLKTCAILFGVALGSLLSHGIAIIFGSHLGALENETWQQFLPIFTYFSFILFGILTLRNQPKPIQTPSHKHTFLQFLSNIGLGSIVMIAFSIAIGELGDKTFLASLGLGISYPHQKLFLVSGAILGMVISDSIAIACGKILQHKISSQIMHRLSGFLFLGFGLLGFLSLLW